MGRYAAGILCDTSIDGRNLAVNHAEERF